MTRSILKARAKAFLDDQSGNITVEFVLAMPILFWAFMACYVFFDGYRQSAANLKAAYTISDLVSRETEGINDAYVDSMSNVLQLMTRENAKVDLRLSVIRWDEEDNRYYLDWSANRGFESALTNANIVEIENRLPTMPDNERVILVETHNRFMPLFNIGLGEVNLDNFVFTRPRFVSQLVWETPDDYLEDNATDDPI